MPISKFTSSIAGSLISKAADALFPPQCLSCSDIITGHGMLCADCWRKIKFIAGPVCNACGIPFEYGMGDDAVCGACYADPPEFAMARSVFAYDDFSRKLVTDFKYADRLIGAPVFAKWMGERSTDIMQGAAALVPVPLHYSRLVSRRYNQSALLARQISSLTGVPAVVSALKRVKRTPPQSGLDRGKREKNVRGAFRVDAGFAESSSNSGGSSFALRASGDKSSPATPTAKAGVVAALLREFPSFIWRKHSVEKLAGAVIVLVDDVMTSGATANACARALKKAGAAEVRVLTLARRVLS